MTLRRKLGPQRVNTATWYCPGMSVSKLEYQTVV